MAERGLWEGGCLILRGMLSADPFTEGQDGYALLFQTGETFQGEPLIGRQNPHDLFMELAATLEQRLGERRSIFAYLAYPGAAVRLARFAGLDLLLGGQGTAHLIDGALEPAYGTFPLAFQVFLKLRPGPILVPGHMH